MHRSRIGVALIDHPSHTYAAAAAFWEAALGVSAQPQADGPYASLTRLDGIALELQRTGDGTQPRVHLDIETDDVAAEVERLVQLGASIDEDHGDYFVMRDPGAMVFCVVPVWTPDFDEHATARGR